MRLETNRLYLRELEEQDYGSLCELLQDEQTMYAYEGAFSEQESRAWLENQFRRYREEGFGLNAVVLKESGELIGQCGLTWQFFNDERWLEIGYLLKRRFWHQGYATEAAKAYKRYAFDVLGAAQVCSIVRCTNVPSQRVAERLGMSVVDHWVKRYRGVDMPHYLYCVKRDGC